MKSVKIYCYSIKTEEFCLSVIDNCIKELENELNKTELTNEDIEQAEFILIDTVWSMICAFRINSELQMKCEDIINILYENIVKEKNLLKAQMNCYKAFNFQLPNVKKIDLS